MRSETSSMSTISTLRSLLSIVVSSLGALAIGVMAVAVAGYLLLAALGLAWTPYSCLATVHQRIAGLSGFDFEISETNCDFLAKEAEMDVFIAKAGQTQKTLLFKYVPPGFDAMPAIASLDDHTVQISIWRVPTILCRRDKWETLTVKYNIGVVDYPLRGAVPECEN